MNEIAQASTVVSSHLPLDRQSCALTRSLLPTFQATLVDSLFALVYSTCVYIVSMEDVKFVISEERARICELDTDRHSLSPRQVTYLPPVCDLLLPLA